MIYYVIILAVIAVDQLVKLAVKMNMELGQTVPVIEGMFHLTYIHNYGAAFSMMEGRQFILIGVCSVLVLGLLCLLIQKRKTANRWLLMAFALIISGGVGNLIDRVMQGYVVDLFDFRIWPIFNIADIAVVCGAGLLILYLLVIEPKLEKQKQERVEEKGEVK